MIKKSNKLKLLCNICFFIVFRTATALADAAGATEQRTPVKEGQSGTGVDLYLGIDLGGALSLSERTSKESHKAGPFLGLKGLSSVYLSQAVIDLGGGWFKSHIRGKAMTPSRAATDVESIDTQIGFAEFGVRYRSLAPGEFNENSVQNQGWEWGPLAQMTFGADSQFSPIPSSKNNNVFLGASLIAPHRGRSGVWRWGVSLLTDLTINQRQMFLLTLTGQAGVSLLRPDPGVVEVRRQSETVTIRDDDTDQKTPEKSNEKAESVAHKQDAVTCTEAPGVLVLGPLVNFVTAKSTLTKRDRSYLKEMVEHLKKQTENWKSITLNAHADSRGTPQRNKALAQKRAESVRDVLVDCGVSEQKINMRVVGDTEPLGDEVDALSRGRNRRVEVFIDGVVKPEFIVKQFEQMYRKYHTPSTCESAGCP